MVRSQKITNQKITNIERYHPELYSEFDYIIDARGIYGGEVNAIAIRAYWSIRLADFPQDFLSKAQIYFDKALGVSGYGWIFPVAVGLELVKLNVGVGVWIDEYNKRKVNIIMLFSEFIQRNQATK